MTYCKESCFWMLGLGLGRTDSFRDVAGHPEATNKLPMAWWPWQFMGNIFRMEGPLTQRRGWIDFPNGSDIWVTIPACLDPVCKYLRWSVLNKQCFFLVTIGNWYSSQAGTKKVCRHTVGPWGPATHLTLYIPLLYLPYIVWIVTPKQPIWGGSFTEMMALKVFS